MIAVLKEVLDNFIVAIVGRAVWTSRSIKSWLLQFAPIFERNPSAWEVMAWVNIIMPLIPHTCWNPHKIAGVELQPASALDPQRAASRLDVEGFVVTQAVHRNRPTIEREDRGPT